jgi:predicted  nucleic acid-binding Zn-ribbon protein
MIDDLKFLIELQKIDSAIQELEMSKEEFPKQVEELKGLIAEAEAKIASLDQKMEEIEKEEKDVKDRIVNAKSGLERSQEKLNSITTNREYDAVHSEIEAQKTGIANGENRLKNFSDDRENLKTAREEAVEELENIRTENQPKIDELQSRIASIDSDIAEVVKKREQVAPKIRPSYLRTYDHIHKRRKKSPSVGQVTDVDRTCPVCYKVLETQLVNEIRKGNRLQICQSCGTILVWNEESETAADSEQ